ncbi:hypothetical protein OSB04_005267 [Centaurea solstitialis]|uniref:Uncharacterized protein n=1 Tax=Centaurea solstitialis TaxID=347529 RepID=A0AA38WGA2_9ASTR|nr:hypothetical protein OSB04_005267 [Centaurea solstitialis]
MVVEIPLGKMCSFGDNGSSYGLSGLVLPVRERIRSEVPGFASSVSMDKIRKDGVKVDVTMNLPEPKQPAFFIERHDAEATEEAEAARDDNLGNGSVAGQSVSIVVAR